jgi:8-oxo-dGTP diphosphatase
MTHNPHAHCGYCGSKFTSEAWPRVCGACSRITWRNPLPVVVAVMKIGRGVLLIRRNIQPGYGKLALPGGFLDYGETWQEGMARELREETGIQMPPSSFNLHRVASSADKKHVLIFGVTPWHIIEDRALAQVKAFQPNPEVSELVITERPVELAFQTHTEVLAHYLGGTHAV